MIRCHLTGASQACKVTQPASQLIAPPMEFTVFPFQNTLEQLIKTKDDVFMIRAGIKSSLNAP
jgi:hypothetical protein